MNNVLSLLDDIRVGFRERHALFLGLCCITVDVAAAGYHLLISQEIADLLKDEYPANLLVPPCP